MELRIRHVERLTSEERTGIMRRSEEDIGSVEPAVREILERVRTGGDAEVLAYTERLDHVTLAGTDIRVSAEETRTAADSLDHDIKTAIAGAVENVTAFHRAQKPHPMNAVETRPGLLVAERATPVESVGLYVPRGRGSFPSMLYMLAVPAKLAGVPRICVVTPPNPDGTVDPACLFAADLCGVDEVYRIGGAQAVAALAYGTETIPPVKKLVGPGSKYVAAAKRLLYGVVDVGLPAGPSESIVLADDTADAWTTALDLMTEAEHGSDSSALLVTTSSDLASRVAEAVNVLIEDLPPERRTFVEDVLTGYGGIIICPNKDSAVDFVNEFAPEHLSVRTGDPWEWVSHIKNAGEILIGPHTPFTLANYAAGANAVLPTGGTAATYSPVSVRDFMKFSSIVQAGETALASLTESVVRLAEYEGFAAHAAALKRRSDTEA